MTAASICLLKRASASRPSGKVGTTTITTCLPMVRLYLAPQAGDELVLSSVVREEFRSH
jgi:hypothetical protein